MRARNRSSRRAALRLDDIADEALALDLGAPLTIRVSARARRVALRVDAAERTVELVLPSGVSARHGLDFVATKRGWIAARLDALPPPVPFVEGAIVPILGLPHRIRRESSAAAPVVTIAEGEIRVKGDPAHLARRLRDHLKALARAELARRAHALASRIDRRVVQVGVRDTKSRWGSCSARGHLSFCWRLIFAPAAVVDYVVAHEVAHLAEMNHGPRFWQLVETLNPGSDAPRAWLKRHRSRLLSYG